MCGIVGWSNLKNNIRDYSDIMDEMIDTCIQFLDEFNKDSEEKLTKEQAIAQMRQFFPTLKRWKK